MKYISYEIYIYAFPRKNILFFSLNKRCKSDIILSIFLLLYFECIMSLSAGISLNF